MSLWFWILLWVALCALALLFIALLGWRLFRRFMAAWREFEAAAGRAGSGLAAVPPVPGGGKPFRPAVFRDPAQVKEEYLSGKEQRREKRRLSRVARRTERGQRQSLRDLHLS